VREAYRVGVNGEGWWEELINTDAETYGGSNVGNFGGQEAEAIPWQGKSHSLLLRLPPLAMVGFKRRT
jgi:1,4-alpha-glucan branching enzyme